MSISVLVCDRPETVEQTASAVSSAGHEVEQAVEGFRALELAERSHPEVVVLRAGLPGRPVADIVRRLKSLLSPPGVVVILAGLDADESARVLTAGADAVIEPHPHPGYLSWTVERVAEGGVVLSPLIARELVGRFAETVTQQQEWSRSLADSARHAEELSGAKADLLANVSHELRTPLTVIKGLIAVLRRSNATPEDREEFLRLVEEAADKLTTMVDNLVTLSDMERGRLRLDLHPCNLADVVRGGAALAASGYPDVQVEISVPESIPATADADRLREVVRQIVDNACRYSAPGDAVRVRAKLADEGITVHVSDRGRGLHRGVVNAAFGQPFTPGEEILTKERAGLGMGLNLARSLVTLHGGIMWAEPLPGGGTRVAFTLPPGGVGEEAARRAEETPSQPSRLRELPLPVGFKAIEDEVVAPEHDSTIGDATLVEDAPEGRAPGDPGPEGDKGPDQSGGTATASSAS